MLRPLVDPNVELVFETPDIAGLQFDSDEGKVRRCCATSSRTR
jgi:hypothetical protein